MYRLRNRAAPNPKVFKETFRDAYQCISLKFFSSTSKYQQIFFTLLSQCHLFLFSFYKACERFCPQTMQLVFLQPVKIVQSLNLSKSHNDPLCPRKRVLPWLPWWGSFAKSSFFHSGCNYEVGKMFYCGSRIMQQTKPGDILILIWKAFTLQLIFLKKTLCAAAAEQSQLLATTGSNFLLFSQISESHWLWG